MRASIVTCLCLALPLLGCGDDRGTTDAAETSAGDGDGDPTGDGDGDPTGEGDPTGDGDGDPTGDGDGDPTREGDPTGDGDGDPTGDGDGDADPTGECDGAEQCVLVNDCCTCDVVLVGEEPPCDVPECFAPTCDAQGFTPEAACLVGTCSPAPVSCDISQVTCEIEPPPPCEGGLVRSVNGDCYGPCVEPSVCEGLPFECDAATCGDGYACMTSQSGASSRCVPLPPACDGSPSCECVSPWWNEVCAGSCGDGGATLLCEDGG